ncbi:MnhB domain-containing protein [Streptomyces sp. NPDC059740]|uniref:MnhB domain-containing protein n=1 Tax=Streptomyces sp. NPDC059740 TaxID=3346926 RepID=UPI0036544DB9
MSRRSRTLMFLAGAAVIATALATTALHMPPFGTAHHPYGRRAVAAALRQHTANTVSSVNFDLRALDTMGEEYILFASVLGAVVLLRRARDERVARPEPARVSPPVTLLGVALMPVALLVGVYVVAHGALTPGGGFQGGVLLATGLHIAYLAADYRVLRRVRPMVVLEAADAVGAAAFAALGLTGLVAGAAYLQNTLPLGTFGQLASAGLVPLLNAAVGLEVASGIVVLLAQFLEQAVEITPPGPDRRPTTPPGPPPAHR